MKRDPRVDPKLGDVLQTEKFRRTVERIADGYIYYRRRGIDLTGYHNRTKIGGWMRWAKNAEVIHAAD